MVAKNDGFSLVELIVSMAILMIAAAAMIGFFSYCIRQFKQGNAQVDLQYESQVFDNRFKNHLMQAQGVYVTTSKQTIYLQQEDRLEKFSLDKDKAQIHYQTYTLSQGKWQADGEEVCFASYVEDWSLTCLDQEGAALTESDLPQTAKICFSYEMKALDKSYETKETVAFRSRIIYQVPAGL